MATAATAGSATVTPKHVFGVKADVTDNVAYLDEQTAMFPAGHNLVIHNTEQRAQKFVPGSEGSLGIIAMCVSNNRKFVAVAERSDRLGEKPSVTIYDLHTLRKRRTLPSPPPEVESRDLVCLAFSPDSKSLLTLSGSPDWTLCVWAWEKPKPPTAFLRVSNPQHAELRQASFSPYDNTAICVTGNGICKFCRLHDNTLKPIPASMGRREPQPYTCHAWLADDRVLIGAPAAPSLPSCGTPLPSRGILPAGRRPSCALACVAARRMAPARWLAADSFPSPACEQLSHERGPFARWPAPAGHLRWPRCGARRHGRGQPPRDRLGRVQARACALARRRERH